MKVRQLIELLEDKLAKKEILPGDELTNEIQIIKEHGKIKLASTPSESLSR